MGEQPGHALTRPSIPDPARDGPPDQEDQERTAGERDPAPQDGDHRRRSEEHREELVERAEHQVVEPGLAATRDLVLCEPVPHAPGDAGDGAADGVRQQTREEEQVDRPEEGEVSKPREPRQAPGRATRGGESPERHRETRTREHGHDRRSPHQPLRSWIPVERVPSEQHIRRPGGERQHERQHEHGKVARPLTVGLRGVRPMWQRPKNEERPDDGAEDRGALLRDERQRHADGQRVEPPRTTILEITERRVRPGDGEDQEVDVLADVAAVEEQGRADHRQRPRAGRGRPADVRPEEPHREDETDPQDGRREPRRDVAVAEERVDGRVDVIEERPVIRRVVTIDAAHEQLVRAERVDALVVAHDPDAEVVEPCHGGRDEQREPHAGLPAGDRRFAAPVKVSDQRILRMHRRADASGAPGRTAPLTRCPPHARTPARVRRRL